KMEKDIVRLDSDKIKGTEHDLLKNYLENGDLDNLHISNYVFKLESEPIKIRALKNESSRLTGYYFSPDAGDKCAILIFDGNVANVISNVAYSKSLNS